MDSGRQSLTDPRFRYALSAMVRRRVPESDVEDIVQSALAEAFASSSAPPDPEALRRWVWGVARHKVADFYRRARRERLDLPELEAEGAPHSENDLLRWAARELPPGRDAEETLEWMLREGAGEKLESIAESAKVPAPRVRQRVSRLRKHLRSRWQMELAALAALGVLVALALYAFRKPEAGAPITHDVPGVPSVEAPRAIAERERGRAFERCDAGAFQECLDALDRAAGLDPVGDATERVQRARDAAKKALAPAPAPAPAPILAPTKTETETPTAPTATVAKPDRSSGPPRPQGSDVSGSSL